MAGNIDVADVIRRLNKKLDEIEKGEVEVKEVEKQQVSVIKTTTPTQVAVQTPVKGETFYIDKLKGNSGAVGEPEKAFLVEESTKPVKSLDELETLLNKYVTLNVSESATSLLLQPLTRDNLKDTLSILGYTITETDGETNECLINSVVIDSWLAVKPDGRVFTKDVYKDDIRALRLEAATNLYNRSVEKDATIPNLRKPPYTKLYDDRPEPTPVAPYSEIRDLYAKESQMSIEALIPNVVYFPGILRSCAYIVISFNGDIVTLSKLFTKPSKKANQASRNINETDTSLVNGRNPPTGYDLLKGLLDVETSISSYGIRLPPFPALVMYDSGVVKNDANDNEAEITTPVDFGHYSRIDPMDRTIKPTIAPYDSLRPLVDKIESN